MIAFDVSLNGQRLCVASAGHTGVLTAGVTWLLREAPGVSDPSDLQLRIGGMSEQSYLDWPVPRKLQVGDEILIRIVDAASADPPATETRDDKKFVETEERKYYERLKAKFEPPTRD